MHSLAFYFAFLVPPRPVGPLPPPHVPTRLPDLELLQWGAFWTFGSDFKEMLPIHQNLSLCSSGE